MYTGAAERQHEGVRIQSSTRTWVIVWFSWQCQIGSAQPAPSEEPPPRPPAADAEAKARVLFDAIVSDTPERAASVFFPRDAFLKVKDMRDPGRYYDRLRSRFDQDVHALHAVLPDPSSARFERFELARRGGFVRAHEEANLLPYWAARHSFIYYRAGNQLRKLEVRVMITWDDRWYVIHLNEFR